jgi:ATP-dependent Lon protease
VKHTVGMTGEVTLRGRVLAVGGLEQKALAAQAAGRTDVINAFARFAEMG